jgi:hypothetical protein
MNREHKILIILGLCILGLFFRLLLVRLYPQKLLYDSQQYYDFALQIVKGGPVIQQSRAFGYPLILSIIFRLFGEDNLRAWIVFQGCLDVLAGLMIYNLAKKISGNSLFAGVSFTAYLFNLYTSTYTGTMLSEITILFLITLSGYLLFNYWQSNKIRYLFLAGAVTGYIPEVKPIFLPFILMMGVLLVIGINKYNLKRKLVYACIFLCLLLLPLSYNIYANYKYFGQIAPTTIDNPFIREFYISLFVEKVPQRPSTPDYYPAEVQQLYVEYGDAYQTKEQRQKTVEKYLILGINKVKEDPRYFISSHIAKLWHVWEKYFVYYLTGPDDKTFNSFIYWGNNDILWIKSKVYRKNNKERSIFARYILALVIFTTLVHVFSNGEGRFTIPLYPYVFLFFGIGLMGGLDTLIRGISMVGPGKKPK